MFKNLTLGKRIAFGFAGLLALTAIIGGLAMFNMRTASESAHRMVEDIVPQSGFCNEMHDAVGRARINIRTYQYTGDAKSYEAATKAFADLEKAIAEALEFAEKHNLTEFKKSLEEIKENAGKFQVDVKNTYEKTNQQVTLRENIYKARDKFEELGNGYFKEQIGKLSVDVKAKADEEILLHRVIK